MAAKQYSFGKHYLVEFIGCPGERLRYVDDIRGPLLEAARLSGATVLESYFHQFEPQGVTGMIFIAESHFSIHTWPESGYAAFDILTCGEMFPDKAIDHLNGVLQAARVEMRILTRGFSEETS
ncbi:MAG: adenosylmethionine decarboxylase [Candidatus Omnitrophica bacterium]|nr:adenosylmethionine decarboxylase [Candidatus Omnitrophota bacterium]